jgi:PAS domain S-box-containing protein
MKKTRNESAGATSLRKSAESQLTENRKSQEVGTGECKAHDESQRPIQELQIHKLLHETILQGVVYQDAEGKIISMNPAAVRILGRNPNELLIHTSENGEHPTLRADGSLLPGCDHPSMVALRTGRESRDVVMGVYNPREMDYRWINVRAMPLFRSEDDKPSQVYIIFDDITERRRIEKTLQDSEIRYRRLFEAAQDGILIINAETGQIVDVNQFLIDMLGYSHEEFVGKRLWEIGAFKDIGDSKIAFTELQNKQYIRYENLPVETKDGRLISVEFVSNVYLVDHSKVIQCNIRDITERKRIEDAQLFLINRSSTPSGEDFFISLARYLGETLEMDYVCIDRLVNEDLSAQTVAIYFDGKYEDNVTYTLKDTPCGKVVGKAICCFPRDVSKLFPDDAVLREMNAESYMGVTLWSSQGHPIGLIAVIGRKPLVDPKLAESILQLVAIRAAGELERRDTEEELKRRADQLEEVNKELESFSYSVSHDLRSPLRAIDGYSRMILKKQGDIFDEDTRSKFNLIRESTQKMGQLIEDLLAFSRLGKARLSINKLDMTDLVLDVWNELQFTNPDRRIHFKAVNVPMGTVDRSLIKQVFVNILSNAIKFTRVRATALIEVGGYEKENEIVYYVRDNGIGFDMKYHEKLFGVFQRLHSNDDYEGTGIGLALVQRIIHRHGGRVWAEGEVDKGATFYFSLPDVMKEVCD